MAHYPDPAGNYGCGTFAGIVSLHSNTADRPEPRPLFDVHVTRPNTYTGSDGSRGTSPTTTKGRGSFQRQNSQRTYREFSGQWRPRKIRLQRRKRRGRLRIVTLAGVETFRRDLREFCNGVHVSRSAIFRPGNAEFRIALAARVVNVKLSLPELHLLILLAGHVLKGVCRWTLIEKDRAGAVRFFIRKRICFEDRRHLRP